MKLYHGTNYSSAINIVNHGIDLKYSKPYLDFGPGFYTTPSYDHAALAAIRTTQKYNAKNNKNEEPYIVEVDDKCNGFSNRFLSTTFGKMGKICPE